MPGPCIELRLDFCMLVLENFSLLYNLCENYFFVTFLSRSCKLAFLRSMSCQLGPPADAILSFDFSFSLILCEVLTRSGSFHG